MIEREGRLGTGSLCTFDKSYYQIRCAIGVIFDVTFVEGRRLDKVKPFSDWASTNIGLANKVIAANDEFKGTPEERAVYMAQWFRDLEVTQTT